MKIKILIFLIPLLTMTGVVNGSRQTPEQRHIVSIERIWDRAPHNAFTDLIEYRGSLYCAFREGSGHVPGREGYDGSIRIIRSDDGANWRSAALLTEDSIDLRDPKLSIAPDGRLMVLMGGSEYHGAELKGYTSRVSFLNRAGFSAPEAIKLDSAIRTGKDWLWRVTWHSGRGYGVVYQPAADPNETLIQLVATRDGVRYDLVTPLGISGRPNETTLRFMPDGEMIAWVRREGGNQNGVIGFSRPPYREWKWKEQTMRLGGPNFIRLPGGELIGATRAHRPDNRRVTMIVRLDREGGIEPLVALPSGGDTSYPGMVLRNGKLLVSYYSSHEGRTAIYMAVIRLP